MSRSLRSRFFATAPGRQFVRVFRPLVQYLRRLRNPDIPADQRLIAVECYGRKCVLQYRPDGSDMNVINQCFEHTQYELPSGTQADFIQSRYDQILRSASKPLIVDCGANIGASAVWFSRRYPEAHIVAIEPAADNVLLLRRNTVGLDIDIYEAGIDCSDGVGSLQGTSDEAWGYRVGPPDDAGDKIPMISLPTILAQRPSSQYTPFLIKIDIEGGEKTLFAGDTKAFNEFPVIAIELHDWMLPGQATSHSFLSFHAASGREFAMFGENVFSLAMRTD